MKTLIAPLLLRIRLRFIKTTSKPEELRARITRSSTNVTSDPTRRGSTQLGCTMRATDQDYIAVFEGQSITQTVKFISDNEKGR